MYRRARCIRSSFIAAGLATMLYPALSGAQTPEESPAHDPQQAPPAGYYPQRPAYSPPAIATEPSEPAFRRGFLAMPYIGANIPVGDAGDNYDAGLRLGTLLGGHINPAVSLNGELTIDVLNPKGLPSGADVTAVLVDMLFSPLFHFGSEAFEGFIGPKLGAFALSASAKYRGESLDETAQGFAYGFNAGFGIPVGKMAIGGLFSYVGRHATKACAKIAGSAEQCDDSPGGDDMHSLAFSGMVLF